jgi:hypothetical protein
MAVSVGSLRFDLVANSKGLVSGLRKARKEMDKTARAGKKSGLGGGKGFANFAGGQGTAGGISNVLGKVGPVFAAVAAAVGSAVVAFRQLERVTTEQVKTLETLVQQTRARGVRGRTLAQQQALNRAQADPLARGPEFAMRQLQQSGAIMTARQQAAMIQVGDSQRRLGDALQGLKNEFAQSSAGMITALNNFSAQSVQELAETKSYMRDWQRIWAEERAVRYGVGAARTADAQSELMMERLRAQDVANRLTQRTTADISGRLPRPGGGRAGSAQEYEFFVRRQDRVRNEELEIAREQNRLLTEIRDKLETEVNPATGQPTGGGGV